MTKPKTPTFSMKDVKSSQIHSVGHCPVTNTLAVKFHNGGSVYHYEGVTAKQFEELHKADSIGAHLGKHIKGAHKFTKQG